MTNRGRPREFRNAADKQKAYRERKKHSDDDLKHALILLEGVKEKVMALRNSVDYWTAKGKTIQITSNNHTHKILRHGLWMDMIEDSVFQYLLMTDQLEFHHRSIGETYYHLKEVDNA